MSDVAEIEQRLDELEKRFAAAERERETAARERDEYRTLYLETMERCRKLELGILASKSEHLPDNDAQLSLGVLSMMLSERQATDLDVALAAANAEQEIKAHTCAGEKRICDRIPRRIADRQAHAPTKGQRSESPFVAALLARLPHASAA